jgi:hypothetical protein
MAYGEPLRWGASPPDRVVAKNRGEAQRFRRNGLFQAGRKPMAKEYELEPAAPSNSAGQSEPAHGPGTHPAIQERQRYQAQGDQPF